MTQDEIKQAIANKANDWLENRRGILYRAIRAIEPQLTARRIRFFAGLMWMLICILLSSCAAQIITKKVRIRDNSLNNRLIYVGDNKLTITVKHDEKYGGAHFVFFDGDSLVILTTENTVIIKGLECIKCTKKSL